MQITEIIVNAGRTFNHPYESYSNMRPSITLKATIEEGEDPIAATKALQAQAEGLIEDHKHHMLKSLAYLHDLEVCQAEVVRFERMIQDSQRDLDGFRNGLEATHPLLPEALLPEADDVSL